MTPADRLMKVLDEIAVDAELARLQIIAEKGPDSEISASIAIFKTAFNLGVAVGLSEDGEQVLTALQVIGPADMTEGVAEIHAALGVPDDPWPSPGYIETSAGDVQGRGLE